MTETPKTPHAEAAEIAAEPKNKGKVTPEADHDRVVMASRYPDGSPRQSPDFEFIGDKDAAKAAAAEQRSQQAVSAVDVAIRGVQSGDGAPGEPDAAVAELKDAHDAAASSARKSATSEVEDRHAGLGD